MSGTDLNKSNIIAMTSKILQGKRILVTGGTGSLGKTLIKRLLTGEMGEPSKITIFSRDEGKQHALRVEYMKRRTATEEILYNNFSRYIDFRIGDVRNFDSVLPALLHSDIVINAAALKQVPACEYFPHEAVLTNIIGASNITRAISNFKLPVETVVCISTDKAAKPINVMGMTKAVQERVFLSANAHSDHTRYIAVRYGNVLASRGSVVPLFHDQIAHGGPITITDSRMTRFLLSLNDSVDLIFEALRHAKPGETYVPQVPSAKVVDVATALVGDRDIETKMIGVRPGEKLHEILVSEEEAIVAFARGRCYVIPSVLPEIAQLPETGTEYLGKEYSSEDHTMGLGEVRSLLERNNLLYEPGSTSDTELLG